MNTRIELLVLSVMAIAASGFAFAGCGNPPSYLTKAQLDSVLPNNFACGRSTSVNPPGWNEKHIGGGTLQEQHEGGGSVESVGTWATSDVGGRGRVTYTYSPGGSVFVYEVAVHADGNCNSGPLPQCTTVPQAYDFCRVSPGVATLRIYVSTTFQAPTGGPPDPWVMNANCPGNP